MCVCMHACIACMYLFIYLSTYTISTYYACLSNHDILHCLPPTFHYYCYYLELWRICQHKAKQRMYGDRTLCIAMMFAKVLSACNSLVISDTTYYSKMLTWSGIKTHSITSMMHPIHTMILICTFKMMVHIVSRYAPYSANSGFYYVRNNATYEIYLLRIIAYISGDMILASGSRIKKHWFKCWRNHASMVWITGQGLESRYGRLSWWVALSYA